MNIWVRRSLALVVACALSGCAIVSPQLTPQVEVAGTWNEATGTDAAAVSPTWWTAFGSPELQSLITEALAGSPDLAIATERVQQAEAQVRVAGASLFPVLSAQGSTAGHRTSTVGGGRSGETFVDSGGITRDLLIGAVPPGAVSDWHYLGVSVLAGLVTFYFPSRVRREWAGRSPGPLMTDARPLRSAPAQNTLPAPVSTTTRTSSISEMRSSASVSSSLSVRVSAFTGGALSVRVATKLSSV